MYENDAADVFWQHIGGPARLVRDAAQALVERRSVLLRVPCDLPWRATLRAEVLRRLSAERPSALCTEVDCTDECADTVTEDAVGIYLLGAHASSAADGYRARMGLPVAHHLARTGALRNQVFWVKGMGAEHQRAWAHFAQHYAEIAGEGALFVLECRRLPHAVPFKPGSRLTELVYDEKVSDYDVLLFNAWLTDGRPGSPLWRQYVAQAATAVCGRDVQASCAWLECEDFTGDNPLASLRALSEREERTGACPCGASHPFARIRRMDDNELRRCLWKAQVQLAFPLLEQERTEFVHRNEHHIRRAIQENGGSVHQFMDEVTEPMEMELGTLRSLSNTRNNGVYRLYLPDLAERERLDFLHSMRNELAHATLTTPQNLQRLFDRAMR